MQDQEAKFLAEKISNAPKAEKTPVHGAENTIVLYTAITDDYDEVCEIRNVETGIDYVCLVDERFSGKIPMPWCRQEVANLNLAGKDLARYCKINGHRFFPRHHISVWIDGNIGVIGSLLQLLSSLPEAEEQLVACYDHWCRSNIREEMYACAKVPHDAAWKLEAQRKRYEADGYPFEQLFETNVLIRRNTGQVARAMQTWWREYELGGKRDQYSFTYAMFKHGIPVFSLGRSDPRFFGHFFSYQSHKKPPSRTVARMVLAVANIAYMYAIKWKCS